MAMYQSLCRSLIEDLMAGLDGSARTAQTVVRFTVKASLKRAMAAVTINSITAFAMTVLFSN